MPGQPGANQCLLDGLHPHMCCAQLSGEGPREGGLSGGGQAADQDEHGVVVPDGMGRGAVSLPRR